MSANFRCKVCGTLIASYPCPVCGARPAPKDVLLARNPKPSQFPVGKHRYSAYCPVCDMTRVSATPFDRCPYCGSKVHPS